MTRFARFDKKSKKRKIEEIVTEEQAQCKKRPEAESTTLQDQNCATQDEYLKAMKRQMCLREGQNMSLERQSEVDTNGKEANKFKECDYMTQYEGYWVRRSSVSHLAQVYRKKFDRIIASREDGNKDSTLTSTEKITLNRQMKKEKRREHALVCNDIKEGKCEGVKNFNSNFTKFSGYNVTVEGAEKLLMIADEMRDQGFTKIQINEALRRERRKEEKVCKRIKNKFCYKCRQSGHNLSSCTESENAGLCYKCGSKEHTSRSCHAKEGKSSFAFADCFHCGGTGHIARECPSNSRGLYPNGGSCLLCESVNHLRKDCPQAKKQKDGEIQAEIRTYNDDLEDIKFDEDFAPEKRIVKTKDKKIKEVNF